jgi:8-oxo-dGTP pyrophosphatase MutT (NUDIX family)
VTRRGGPQRIPRPPTTTVGEPAPWAGLDPAARVVTIDDLRAAFTGRRGAPSLVEGDRGVRPSAVLAPLYEEDGETNVVLTRRSPHLRAHQGEVSFPGGAVDDGESLEDAARREAREEIGLDPASVEILGELDHLMTITSRSFIVPFVAVLPARPEVTPNPHEVDAVLHVPVRELLRDDVYREERWEFSPGVVRPIFFFELVGDTVWGATAAMLRQLLGTALGLGTAIDHA